MLGRYTADMNLTGQLHAKFKYAGHTHARITRIDTSQGAGAPGRVRGRSRTPTCPRCATAAWCQDRLHVREGRRAVRGRRRRGRRRADRGDRRSRRSSLIEVDYEPLPANADIEAAIATAPPLIHEGWADYGGDETMGRDGNTLGHSTIIRGDAAAAMAKADAVVKGRYVADCSQGVPIEPRAIIAQWQGDKVTVWSSTQVPFAARSGVATVLEIPESHVRIDRAAARRRLRLQVRLPLRGPRRRAGARARGGPVKLVFSRHEEFIAPDHRREGMVIELETGVKKDGTIVARRGKLVLDGGAYCGEGGFFAQMAAMHAIGPYQIQNVDIDSYLVYTNNQPSSSIRAPTAPQACWAVEQHMDEVAAAIGMDAVELRRRSLIEEGKPGATGQVYDADRHAETLEKAGRDDRLGPGPARRTRRSASRAAGGRRSACPRART